MAAPALGLDHLMITTPDLELAFHSLERLGFAITPRGEHESLATANHTALFDDTTYIELLGIVSPTPANAPYRRAIEVIGEGVGGIALATEDAAGFYAAADRAGLAPQAAMTFARNVDRPTGMAQARFTIVRLPEDALPPLSIFACQHHTPDLVWLDDRPAHPNGALGLVRLGFSDFEGRAAALFERLLDGRASRSESTVRLETDRISLSFSPTAGPRHPRADLIGVAVRDLAHVHAMLDRRNIASRIVSGLLCVDPLPGLGVGFQFSQS